MIPSLLDVPAAAGVSDLSTESSAHPALADDAASLFASLLAGFKAPLVVDGDAPGPGDVASPMAALPPQRPAVLLQGVPDGPDGPGPWAGNGPGAWSLASIAGFAMSPSLLAGSVTPHAMAGESGIDAAVGDRIRPYRSEPSSGALAVVVAEDAPLPGATAVAPGGGGQPATAMGIVLGSQAEPATGDQALPRHAGGGQASADLPAQPRIPAGTPHMPAADQPRPGRAQPALVARTAGTAGTVGTGGTAAGTSEPMNQIPTESLSAQAPPTAPVAAVPNVVAQGARATSADEALPTSPEEPAGEVASAPRPAADAPAMPPVGHAVGIPVAGGDRPHASLLGAVSRLPVEGPGADPTAARHIQAQVTRAILAGSGLNSGDQTLTLQLEPDHLGKVEVRLMARGGRLEVTFTAETPEAQQALREGTSDLMRSLASRVDGRWQHIDIKVADPTEPRRDNAQQDNRDQDRPRDGRREPDQQERRRERRQNQ